MTQNLVIVEDTDWANELTSRSLVAFEGCTLKPGTEIHIFGDIQADTFLGITFRFRNKDDQDKELEVDCQRHFPLEVLATHLVLTVAAAHDEDFRDAALHQALVASFANPLKIHFKGNVVIFTVSIWKLIFFIDVPASRLADFLEAS